MKNNSKRFLTIISIVIIAFFVLTAIFAPLISPPLDENLKAYNQIGSSLDHQPHPPSSEALLGTVTGQYDVFHSLVWGSREALRFGFLATLITAFIGILIGAISAYQGGWFNFIVMRITDSFLTIPLIAAVIFSQMFFVLLSQYIGVEIRINEMGVIETFAVYSDQEPTQFALFLLSIFNRTNPFFLALVLFSWMPYAKIFNTQIINLKNEEFVQSAKVVGAGHGRIIFRHLIPNALAPVVVMAAKDIGAFVALHATFVYLGVTSGNPWAQILVWGKNWIIGPGGSLGGYWWVFFPATLCLVLFGIGWNLLGDQINVWMNPYLRNKIN